MNSKHIGEKLEQHTPSILDSEKFSKYAVLLPLIEKEDGLHILFEVRSFQLRRQPGEICFPGGKIDAQDENEEAAAIRETMEELGVNRQSISKLFPLDFMITPFDMIVYPFAAFIQDPNKLHPNPSEVEEVFTVPITQLLQMKPEIHFVRFKVEPEDNFPYDLIVGGENYKWRTRGMEEYFYRYADKAIWGMTARILAHFIEIIR